MFFRLAHASLSWIEELGSLVRFSQKAFSSIFAPPYRRTITLRQMDAIGVGSLPIVTLTGIFTGMVLALQSIVELRVFGATSYVGRPIGTTIIRELGPVLSAIMVAARSGSAIAAELGSMVVGEQIDALYAEGADPIKKLVEPRLLACILATPLLTLYCDAVGFVGGWLIATQTALITSNFYWNSVFEVISPAYLWGGLIKSICFGSIIGVVGCYSGINTRRDATGVGTATTQAVVISAISVLAVDFLLTKLFIITWW